MLILYLMQHIPFEMRYENMDHTYFIDWPTSLPLRDMIYFVKLMTSYHILYQVALSHIAYSFGLNVCLPSSDTLLKEKKREEESSYKLMARKMWTVNLLYFWVILSLLVRINSSKFDFMVWNNFWGCIKFKQCNYRI